MIKSDKISVHIFLRKPYKFENHSIEKLFNTITKDKDNNFKFKFLICPFYSSGFFKRIFNCFWALFNQGDINHISGDVNFISFFLDKNRTINTFHDCYNLRQYSGFKKMVYKFFWFYIPIKKSKYITTVSNFTKREIKKLVKTKKKIRVISNFIPENNYIIKKKNRKKILIIGTTKNKNLDRILLAVKDLKIELIIVGEININQTKFLKSNKIIYKNFINVSESKLIDLYNQAKILLFPSLYEGFGLTIIEAQRMRVPVITSNISPMKEIVNNSALLVNPKDIKDIRIKLKKLYYNTKLRQTIIKKGYINSLNFDPNNFKKKYFHLYEKIFHYG